MWAVILLLLASPLLSMIGVAFRALILFWPTMLVLGALHTHIEWVPALGWWETFLVLMATGLLIPWTASNDKK